MTDVDNTAPSPQDQPPEPAPERKSRLWIVAIAAVVALGVAMAAVAMRTSEEPKERVSTDDGQTGAVTEEQPASGSCVELYDLETLDNREFAFDGTVKEVRSDRAEFTVNEWFRGGEGDEVSKGGATGSSGLTPEEDYPNVGLAPGERFLVAGDGDFAWACGFTQPYDPEVAADWKRVLAE